MIPFGTIGKAIVSMTDISMSGVVLGVISILRQSFS